MKIHEICTSYNIGLCYLFGSQQERGEALFLEGDTPAVAESYLRRSLKAIFDIGRHIVAKSAGKAAVEYKEIAGAMSREGVITKELGGNLRLMAGYRNRLVHFYHQVSDRELYEIITRNLNDIDRFVKEIRAFLVEYDKQKPAMEKK
jgi:uncharacterized protein YutE (UPF0331/DUF86 family)